MEIDIELYKTVNPAYHRGIEDGKKQYEELLLQAAVCGKPIELNGHVWHLQSDVEYLRKTFVDLEMAAWKDSKKYIWSEWKQRLFQLVADLYLTEKPREEIADCLMKYLAELDKYEVMEDKL